ncbi:hypothetical protein FZ934_20870 (plasmid) [Rhizobium grahamii]|uniref:Uncharacterized protein n=1 Tax=Rhizobium grahamii TaxID=1120045 RepID=A0A5Q0CG28_9HYPH|nr:MULTISPECIES: hypothetical protein [Rhizobium]QFY62809.1 hypothetical protein FZ934_20870 [Rhizobium grahamii]QRM52444.1 hypothetical protein F3Y33_24785 [Rhizobium sp. BG6]
MGDLRIMFIHGEGERADRVSAQIRKVAELDGEPSGEWRDEFRLRMGDFKQLHLGAGHYVVDAMWRNGKSTSYRCVVQSDRDTQLNLRAPSLRRESTTSDRDFSRPSAGGMTRRATASAYVKTYDVFAADDAADTWSFVTDQERIAGQTTLSSQTPPLERSKDLRLENIFSAERHWIKYWTDDGWTVSSLPFDPGIADETCILRSAPAGVPFVIMADPDAAVMADLLPAGNSDAMRRYAAATFDELSEADRLQLARTRPLEVCAFAYAEHENFHQEKWVTMLGNMPSHQKWLSDISVILGWRRLMVARNREEWSYACQTLISAVEVGVPYYSMGVKLLSDAFAMLAGMEGDNYSNYAEKTRSVAARAVPTEAFTTVRT